MCQNSAMDMQTTIAEGLSQFYGGETKDFYPFHKNFQRFEICWRVSKLGERRLL